MISPRLRSYNGRLAALVSVAAFAAAAAAVPTAAYADFAPEFGTVEGVTAPEESVELAPTEAFACGPWTTRRYSTALRSGTVHQRACAQRLSSTRVKGSVQYFLTGNQGYDSVRSYVRGRDVRTDNFSAWYANTALGGCPSGITCRYTPALSIPPGHKAAFHAKVVVNLDGDGRGNLPPTHADQSPLV